MTKNIIRMCLCLLLLGISLNMKSQCSQEMSSLTTGKYLLMPIKGLVVGESGKDCVWDFSDLKYSKSTQTLLCKVDSAGQIEISDDKQISYYAINGDTVWQMGKESPLEILEYTSPICCLKVPIEFCDSISHEFEGNGVYCGDHYLKEKGSYKVVVDGIGDIVFSDADTLRNLFRVYKQKAYAVAMDLDSPVIDSMHLKQVIEERYEWYVKDVPLPLYSTITTTKYVNLMPISTSYRSYCCMPKGFSNMQEYIQSKDSLDSLENVNVKDIIHYDIEKTISKLIVNFNLDSDAYVSMLLANNMGMIYDSKRSHLAKGTGYKFAFDINGLKSGVYVVYINVDGVVYSEKIKV